MKRQLRAASREAAVLKRRAKSPRGARRAATAHRRVARQRNQAVETLAAIVDEASGTLQVKISDLIELQLKGRERALGVLLDLVGRLPEKAQTGISRAIAALSSDGQDEVESLTDALESDELSAQGSEAVEDALARAVAAIDRGLERLSSLVGRVPESARPYVERALGRTTAQLEQVSQWLGGPAPGSVDGGAAPGAPASSQDACDNPLPFMPPGC